jgi:hypothetical protein
MNYGPELLLVGAVATVGVLHTMVSDHWVPITLIARQRGWSKSETARAALQAGIGHVLSTLLIALVVWLAGAAFAQRFGHIVDTVSSLALIAFGSWFAISAWRDLRKHGGREHSHSHDFPQLHGSEEGHDHDGHDHSEHHHDDHDHETALEDDPLYAPLRGETAVITRRVHTHRHGGGSIHRRFAFLDADRGEESQGERVHRVARLMLDDLIYRIPEGSMVLKASPDMLTKFISGG